MRPHGFHFLLLILLILPTSSILANNGRPIFLTAQEVEAVKLKIKTSEWAKKEYEELITDANKLLETSLKEIPVKYGNWNFYYQSPEQHDLSLGKQVGTFQWEHIDKVSGKIYKGDSSNITKNLDGVIIGQIHNLFAKGVVTLGLAYKLTGEKKYAYKAIAILLKYASIYNRLPLLNKKGGTEVSGAGHGKLFTQSLEESVWLINAVSGASLVWNLVKAGDQTFIQDSLFYQVCKPIEDDLLRDAKFNNIDVWEMAALGITGLFFNDKALLDKSLLHPTKGYGAVTQTGITKDGLWFEIAIGYHFYVVHPLIMVSRAAKNCNLTVDNTPIKKMLDGPLAICDNDFAIAGFNDSNTVNLKNMAAYYEWGYNQFGDSNYLAILDKKRGFEVDHPGLYTKFALLFGVPVVERPPSRNVTSYNYPASGLAALTTGSGKNAVWLNIKYDSIFTTHRHFDVGTFEIKKGDTYISKDLGQGNYASNDHRAWVRSSLSHNSYLINKQQQPNKIKVECLAFDKDLHFIRLRSGGVFGTSTVTVYRTIALLDENTIFIADDFTSTGNDSIDFSYHQNGTLVNKPQGKPLKRLTYAYARLLNPISDTTRLEHFSTLLPPGNVATMSYYHNAPTRWILAEGKTRGNVNPYYLVLRRHTAAAPLYWCITLNGGKVIFKEEKKDKEGTHLMLTFSDGRKRMLIIPAPNMALTKQ